MNNFHELDFHESWILRFVKQQTEIIIDLEDVESINCKRNVKIRCVDVDRIEISYIPVDSVFIEENNGEVLTLEISENKLTALVIWHDFESKQMTTKYYEINYDKIHVDVN